MDAKNLPQIIDRLKRDILLEVTDRLPRKAGIVAVNHFRQNFRDAGFRDGGLTPWQKTLRQRGTGTDAAYTPLTSRRNHLMNSTSFTPSPGQVLIENPVPYAAIHNEGGDISTHPRVTDRLRRYAWHMAYSLAGVRGKGKLPKELPREAAKWRAMALTKKQRLNVRARIPKRQFIGESRELTGKITSLINQSLEKIKNGISSLASH